MRRSHLAVFATVSLTALVSVATTSQAVQTPGIIMGILKPTDSWKVGTVNVTGASFCAMVNKYDNGVGLAFARSPEGYGTVAVDLHQDLLTRDTSYEVQLKVDGGQAHKLEGKATSTRSLVVQIGQEKAIYDALSHNGTMEISMPAADVTFSLAKFSNSFKNLLNCSDKLSQKSASAKNDGPKMAAVKVQEVEQDSLAPIDREVQKLNKGEQAAAPEAQNSLDAQLDDAANAEVKQSETNIAKLDQQKQEVTQQIDYGRHEVAQLQDQKQQVERKLIASIRTETPPVPPANTGAVARLWDDQQAQAAAKRMEDQAKADALKDQVAAHDAQIAKIEYTKTQAANEQVAQSAANQKALEDKTAKLEKQRDDLAAKQAANTSSKAIRAALVAKEAQLADAAAQRAAERDQLTQKLAATQATFSDQISALQAERDSLKQQLVAARAEAAQWQDADMADRAQTKDLQARLAQADEARHGLEARVAELSDAQQKTIASASSAQSKELAAAKAELASVKTEDAKKFAELSEQLSDKSAQFDAMKAQFASLKQEGAAKVAAGSAGLAKEHQALADQVAQKQAEIDRLQSKLAQIEADRAAEASKARTAQADLADTRQQLTGMRKSLVVINDNDVPGNSLNDIRPAAGDSDELKKAQAELASLRQKNAELSEQLALEATKPEAVPATEAGKQAQAELASLRQKNAELSKQLADAAQAAQQKSPDLDKAQGELADLRAKNAELTSRLASASDAAPHTTPELAKAQAELADLRAKNAELSSRLASAGAQPAKSDELVEAKAELDGLRAQNADLAAKLAAKPAADDKELADLRQKNAELSDKLAAAAKPGASLDKTQGELADLRAKNAQLEQRLVTIVNSEPQPLPTAGPVPADSAARQQIMAAAAEIAKLRATKVDLEQQLALRTMGATVPSPAAPEMPAAAPAPEAQSLAQLKPSSGDTVSPIVAPEPAAAAPSAASEDPVAPHTAAANLDRSSWWTAANAAAKATRDQVADAADAAPPADPSFDSNRAAAFLDRIMAYHRPAGSPAVSPAKESADVADAAPIFGAVTHAEASAPVPPAAPRHSAQPHPHVAQPAMAAVKHAPALVHVDHGMTEMPDDASLAAVPAPVPQGRHFNIASEPVVSSEPLAAPAAVAHAETVPAPVIRSTIPAELPRLAAAPVARMSGSSPTTLENLLASAGVDAKFKPGDGNTRQWVSGSVNGMYEQLPAGDFTAQAQSYIERYREDCPGGLTINMGQPQTTSAGTFAEANVSCNMTSNSYNTSFVFVQDAKKFSAILHTGYPEDASKVRSIGDNVAYTLGASGGLMAPSSVRKAEAYIPPAPGRAVDAAPVTHHFNVPDTQPVSAKGSAHFGARSDDGLDTVVVQ